MTTAEREIARVRRQCRILMLVDAGERAAITPIPAAKLHAFAYLADVLSPIWNLPAFDGAILKLDGGPHYPDIQIELDRMVVSGLLEIENLSYSDRPGGARIEGSYGLNFSSDHLSDLLNAVGAEGVGRAMDPRDVKTYSFLVDLAQALATLPHDEIDRAASEDATYADTRIDAMNVVYLERETLDGQNANLSVDVTQRFDEFLPKEAVLTPGERLYLYASYLGARVNG